jgi:coenzyme F420-reducing hydrogenase beta subunit
VGSTEWKDDWNTLIVRTAAGAKMVEKAQKARALRVKPFPEERVNLLRGAVLGKKKRVLKAVFEDKSAPEYLALGEQEKNFIKESKPVSGVKK